MLQQVEYGLQEVAFHFWEHNFCFRVAETGVELNHFGAVLGQHQAAVEHTAEGASFGAQRFRGGFHNMFHRPSHLFFGYYGHRRIGAHAARIGAFIAIVGAFVVLRYHQGHHLFTVHQCQQGKFRALQKVLHHHPSFSKMVVLQHIFKRGIRFFGSHSHHHTFTGGQSVVFNHNRGSFGIQIAFRLLIILKSAISGSRDVVFVHQFFGKLLAALNACGGLCGGEDGKSCLMELVGDPIHQGRFRTNDGKIDALFLGEGAKCRSIVFVNGDQVHRSTGFLRNRQHSGIARGNVELRFERRLGSFPSNGVFAAATTDNQYFHHSDFVMTYP